MHDFRIAVHRGEQVESVHRVSAAVTDTAGRLLASAGNPELLTFWRSGAKPFQAMPLVADGVAARFGLGEEELALACASHSSAPRHLELTDRFLARIGRTEADLACGPHPPLDPAIARQVVEERVSLSPRWSNCSGNHAAMLALALHHGWPLGGYERLGHPVQDRMTAEVLRWSGVAPDRLAFGVDGCTTVSFGLPLRHMAVAYARLVTSEAPEAVAIREAMWRHPAIIAGNGRFCTELMQAFPAAIVAKVGAGGVYSAGVPAAGLGIALKVEDGDMRSAPLALCAILDGLRGRGLLPPAFAELTGRLPGWREQPVLTTRGEPVGVVRAAGGLRFAEPAA